MVREQPAHSLASMPLNTSSSAVPHDVCNARRGRAKNVLRAGGCRLPFCLRRYNCRACQGNTISVAGQACMPCPNGQMASSVSGRCRRGGGRLAHPVESVSSEEMSYFNRMRLFALGGFSLTRTRTLSPCTNAPLTQTLRLEGGNFIFRVEGN